MRVWICGEKQRRIVLKGTERVEEKSKNTEGEE
jgi:hypothetical protein